MKYFNQILHAVSSSFCSFLLLFSNFSTCSAKTFSSVELYKLAWPCSCLTISSALISCISLSSFCKSWILCSKIAFSVFGEGGLELWFVFLYIDDKRFFTLRFSSLSLRSHWFCWPFQLCLYKWFSCSLWPKSLKQIFVYFSYNCCLH